MQRTPPPSRATSSSRPLSKKSSPSPPPTTVPPPSSKDNAAPAKEAAPIKKVKQLPAKAEAVTDLQSLLATTSALYSALVGALKEGKTVTASNRDFAILCGAEMLAAAKKLETADAPIPSSPSPPLSTWRSRDLETNWTPF